MRCSLGDETTQFQCLSVYATSKCILERHYCVAYSYGGMKLHTLAYMYMYIYWNLAKLTLRMERKSPSLPDDMMSVLLCDLQVVGSPRLKYHLNTYVRRCVHTSSPSISCFIYGYRSDMHRNSPGILLRHLLRMNQVNIQALITSLDQLFCRLCHHFLLNWQNSLPVCKPRLSTIKSQRVMY